jgi:hypothetical protein
MPSDDSAIECPINLGATPSGRAESASSRTPYDFTLNTDVESETTIVVKHSPDCRPKKNQATFHECSDSSVCCQLGCLDSGEG